MKLLAPVCALLAATTLLTLGSAPAFAIDVAPAPSAAFGEGAAPALPPVSGVDQVTAVPLQCLIGCETAESAPTGTADCFGCYAQNQMKWTEHWQYEYVGIDFSKNVARETIYRQNLHAALISSASNKCYEGTQRFTQNSGEYYYYSSIPVISSGTYKAWDDKWTIASGHLWDEDGYIWTVSGGADMCKQF